MEESASTNNEPPEIKTLSEKDYQKIRASARWHLVISLSAIIIASVLPIYIIALDVLNSYASTGPPPGTGIQVVKKPFINIDILGYGFIFTFYVSWVLLFSLLFSSSRHALAAAKHKLPNEYEKAKRFKSRFNNSLIIWILIFLLIMVLIGVGI